MISKTIASVVYENGTIKVIEYTPSLTKPLLYNFEKMRLVRRVRFLLEYLHHDHYRVYYLQDSGEWIGYCVIAPGGRRLTCSLKTDVVLGPYYIDQKYRGKGYGKLLINLAIKCCSYSFESAYDWIEKKNISSIKASEANGFQKIGELNVVGVRRKLVLTDKGEDNVYQLKQEDFS